MEKSLNNRRPSFDHNQLDNEMSIQAMDTKQEYSNFDNINTAIDTSVYSTFTISEITSESINEFEVTILEDGHEEVVLQDVVDQFHTPSNTILKNEINIEDEPSVPISEMDETEAINPMENRNELPITKKQKVVRKSWKKDAVFQRESDALDAIRNEKIWTNSSDRMSTCSKAIYGCSNFQSDGSWCDSGIYLQYSQLDSSVTLFRSTNKHTCVSIDSYSESLHALNRSMDSNMEIASKSSKGSIEQNIPAIETKDKRKRIGRERSMHYRSEKMALRKANAGERLCKHAKKQKVVRKSWQKDAVFQRESDALDAIRNEKIWTNSSDRTGTCNEAIYGCSNLQSDGSHCDAGIYLQYSQVESSVTLFRSTNKHTCDLTESYREPLSPLDSSMDSNMEIASKSSNESIEKIISATETIDERRIRMQRERSKRYRSKKMALRKANAEKRLHQHALLETIDIDNEPSVLISEMNETQTEAFNPMENRNEDPITKKQKVVRKSWQKDTVFQRESDALAAIRSEKIWTNSGDRTGTCSKAIYGCSNLQSDGSHCDAGIYLQYSQVESSVTMFRSTNKHTCDLIEPNSESVPILISSTDESIEEVISTTEKKDERRRRIRRKCAKRDGSILMGFPSLNGSMESNGNLHDDNFLALSGTDTDNEEDSLNDIADRCQLPSNTILKYEINIDDEPNVPTSKMDETQTETINPMQNRNEEPLTKKQKVVCKSWQKDTVFQRENDALDAIRSEKIWTNSSDRTGTCSEAIYGCSNLQSDGSHCDAGIYLQYSQVESSVTLFRSTNKHTCDLIESNSESVPVLISSTDESIEEVISTTEKKDERRRRIRRKCAKRDGSILMGFPSLNESMESNGNLHDDNFLALSGTDTDNEEDSLNDIADRCQLPSNTILKEEINIDDEPNVPTSKIDETQTEAINPMQNRNVEPITKKQKVVCKSWQKGTVFQRENDALDAIRSEKFWTNSSDRTGTCSKAIYGCTNLQSDGSHCDAGIYLQYSQLDSSVTMFRSTNKHTCDLIESYREPLSPLDSSMDSNMEIASKSSNESIEKIISTTETIDERRIRMQRERSKRYRSKKMALRKANAEERLHQHALLETIDIDNEPSVLISEMNETQTEAFNPVENRNEDPITKKQKVVPKSWQKDTVFQRESDALDAIGSEKIWTNSSDRTGTCSKAIFGCSNLQSDGSQCDSGIYLQYSQVDSSVTLYRSTNRHTCDLIESNSESVPILISSTDESIEEIISTTEKKDDRRRRIRRKCAKRNGSILMRFPSLNGSMESNGNLHGDNFLALSRTDTDNEEDPSNDIADRCHLPSNTILKEEIHIDDEPNVPISKMDETQTETINPMQNRNEEPITKKQNVVCKSWQKDTVFQRENDALDAIRSEKIWTNSSDRTGTCSKAIYGCSNLQSDGSHCDAGIYLQYSQVESSVTLFRSTNKHTCDLIESFREPLSPLDSSMDSNMEIASKSSNESIEKSISTTETIDERRIRMQRERSKRYRSKKMALRKANAEERLHQHALSVTIDIDNEPSALIPEMNETQTVAFNPMENRNEDLITKNQKVVRKSWQKDTVFQRESDALDAIRSEKIWTNSSDRMGTCSKAIYGCKNLQSDRSQCDAGIYLQYSQLDSSVTMFRSTNKHTCDLIEPNSESVPVLISSADCNLEIASKSSKESIEEIISTTETKDERRRRIRREYSKRYRSKQLALKNTTQKRDFPT